MPDMPPLPPWLTRQYDFAGGFRRWGDAVIRSQDAHRLQDEAEMRAGIILRKQVGMHNMQAEAAGLIESGADPLTARKTALLNNAPDLFADNPSAYAHIIDSDEADRIREQAAAQLNSYHNAQLQELSRYHDQLADAKAESATQKAELAVLRANVQLAGQQVRDSHNQAMERIYGGREDRLTRQGDEKLGLTERGLDIRENLGNRRYDIQQENVDSQVAHRANIDKRSDANVDSLIQHRTAQEKLGTTREDRLGRMAIDKDRELRNIDDDLATARQNLQDRLSASPLTAPFRANPDNLRNIVRDLERRREERLNQLQSGTVTPQPLSSPSDGSGGVLGPPMGVEPVAPPKKVFRYDPKTGKLIDPETGKPLL